MKKLIMFVSQQTNMTPVTDIQLHIFPDLAQALESLTKAINEIDLTLPAIVLPLTEN
ncbi:hypothetical protein [Pseudomonas extremaustralis]|uniref:hypothetical protein n=1 Tax=Pseudomonas extremaustralis TaxID=359110 RepID=UPI0015C4986D|nr:hypothetical protein [Pseudomonas extremaustralis]